MAICRGRRQCSGADRLLGDSRSRPLCGRLDKARGRSWGALATLIIYIHTLHLLARYYHCRHTVSFHFIIITHVDPRVAILNIHHELGWCWPPMAMPTVLCDTIAFHLHRKAITEVSRVYARVVSLLLLAVVFHVQSVPPD